MTAEPQRDLQLGTNVSLGTMEQAGEYVGGGKYLRRKQEKSIRAKIVGERKGGGAN